MFGLGMAIGLTWMIAILFVGIFAMIILKNGYSGGWHENVVNSIPPHKQLALRDSFFIFNIKSKLSLVKVIHKSTKYGFNVLVLIHF